MLPPLLRKILPVLAAASLLASALGPAPQPALAAHQNGLSPAPFLNPDGTLNVPENFSGSFDLRGWNVSMDPNLGPILQPVLAPLDNWAALADNGLNSTVTALAVVGTDLYVGGGFGQTSGGATTDLNFIARYNTTAGTWHALADNGLNNSVLALAVVGTDLYVGGFFTASFSGATPGLNRIARYNTSAGTWHALADNGLNSLVLAFTLVGTDLYVGGQFGQTFGGATTGLNFIARYNTTAGTWHALANNGLNAVVRALAVVGTDLYLGGDFTQSSGGATTGLNRIAKYNTIGGSWQALADNGLNGSNVFALGAMGTDLYVGGSFSASSGGAATGLNFIARYSTTSGAWQALADNGLNSTVRALAVVGTDLYVGGSFNQSSGGAIILRRIARYGTAGDGWRALADSGLNSDVQALALIGTDLFAGGIFTASFGGATTGLNRIAAYGIPSVSGGASLGGASDEGGNQGSKDIAATGTTVFHFGRAYVSVPASAIPPGETNCKIVVANKGDSGGYGFELDDVVYDVKIVCDSGPITILFAPITVCIRPKDGVTADKQIFHKHTGASSFAPLAGGSGPAGYVCGSTQMLSLFTLGEFGLPDTGFAPGVVTQLSEKPAATYFEYDALMLEIPQLDVMAPIWGVPQSQNGWDVSWLGEAAGYLYGTTFPTWVGNSVLTAHVWNADNSAGPFYHLRDMQHGDQFYIRAYGQTYVYEVRSNRLVSESNLSVMKDSDYSLITLITCESFSESSGEYLYRRAVQAVLVDVTD